MDTENRQDIDNQQEPETRQELGSSIEPEDFKALEGRQELGSTQELESRQEQLLHRLEQVQALEAEVLRREALIKEKETAKKQVLLRLSPTLWQQIASWAELDFRSINSQIEYILSKAVSEHNRKT